MPLRIISAICVFSLTLRAQNATAPDVPDILKEAMARPPLTLDSFNGMALNANPTLKQAQAIVNRSAAQALQASLWPNPSVGYQGEQIRGGDYGGGEQGAFVGQNFVLGGKLGLRRKTFEAQRQADETGVAEQRLRVLSDVGRHFYRALAAQEVVALRRQLLAVTLDAVETAHQLANVGQADAPDVLQAEVEAEQAKVDLVSAQRDYLQSFQLLAAAAGSLDLPTAPLKGDLETSPNIDIADIGARIVRDSPSVKRAGQQVTRDEAALRSAKRESIPDLALRAGIEQNGEHLPENTNRRVGLQAFATAGITIPLVNRNQGNVRAAEAELDRARNEVTRTQLMLRGAAAPLLQNYQASVLQAERYRNAMIPRAQRAYRLYLDKYRGMGAAYPQVLISQRTLFQLRVAYVNTLASVWMQAVALQNYTLTGALDAPESEGSKALDINLPNSNGVSVQ